MSLMQILTSIQDSSFSTVPRLTAFLAALVLAMPWMLGKLIAYTTTCSATWDGSRTEPMTLGLPVSTMIAFLLVLARVAGLVAFLPVPGFRNAPGSSAWCSRWRSRSRCFRCGRLCRTHCRRSANWSAWRSPKPDSGWWSGLAVAFLTEGFQVAAQVLGVQAGYGFASTIDPTSQADSGVLQVMMTLITGLLFFSPASIVK